MCINCFEEEYDSFVDETRFLTIDRSAKQGVNNGNILYLGNFNKTERNIRSSALEIETNLYQCVHCNEKWVLQEPVKFPGGLLLLYPNYLNQRPDSYIQRYKKFIIGLGIFIGLRIIWYFLTHNG